MKPHGCTQIRDLLHKKRPILEKNLKDLKDHDKEGRETLKGDVVEVVQAVRVI